MRIFIAICLALMLASCEPTADVDESFLVSSILGGDLVKIDGDDVLVNGDFYGALSATVDRHALITCNLFGYPEICSMTGTKGRALGRPTGDPVDTDFAAYREANSEADPGDLGGMLLYSDVWYPHAADTNANKNALRGGVASWAPGWNHARVDF